MRYIFLIGLFFCLGGAFCQNGPLQKDIYFTSGSYELSQESLVTMFEIANTLQSSGYYTIVLTGHADNVGLPVANQKLSEYRVGAVKNYLMQLGLNGDWISADYFGSSQAGKAEVDNKLSNRRVEILVYYYPPFEPAKIQSERIVPPYRVKQGMTKTWED